MRKRMISLCLAVILLFTAQAEPLYAMGNTWGTQPEGRTVTPDDSEDVSGGDAQKTEYTVTFDFAGGTAAGVSGTSAQIKVEEGETILSKDIPVPVRTGYKFQCWVNGAGKQ